MMWDAEIGELSASLRATLARPLDADRSIAAHEQALTALGTTCRYENRVLRCRYRRQVRWTAALYPPHADQHEIQISVVVEKGEGRLAVCHGKITIGSSGGELDFPEDWNVPMSDCSPYTAISEPGMDSPRRDSNSADRPP